MPARRYLAIVQDARGYPAPGDPLEPAPPDGPAQPVIHTVVLADEYERIEREAERLRAIVGKVPREQLGRIMQALGGDA